MYQFISYKYRRYIPILSAIILTSMVIFPSLSFAKTIYVATDGNDNNDGSSNAPYASFNKVNDVISAGDTVIIKEGTYRQTLRINESGTEQSPIIIKAEEGEEVKIVGTEVVTGWSNYQGDIYQASVDMAIDEEFRQVYLNTEAEVQLLQLARWPNDSDNNIFTIDAVEINSKGTTSSFSSSGIPNTDLTGGYVWYLGAHSGTSWTRKITSSSTTNISFEAINDQKWPFNPHAPTILRHNNYGRYFVFGKLSLLDHANEWFYDAQQKLLYLQTADGEMPADTAIEIAARKEAIDLVGDYITVDNIHVFGGNVRIEGDYNTLKIVMCSMACNDLMNLIILMLKWVTAR